jgi:O-antigen/teichoic acid export membrane protein
MPFLDSLKVLARKWGAKPLLAILDQGVFSGSGFLLTLLLARWLTPAEYGIFAVASSVFLFAAGFHNAFILDPLYVLGPSRHPVTAAYASLLVWPHTALTGCASLLLLIAAGATARPNAALAFAFLGLAVCTPFVLLFWLFRAACYVEARPDVSLRGSCIYAATLFAVVLAALGLKRMSNFSVFLAMAAASAAASVALAWWLGVRHRHLRWAAVRTEIFAVLRENWTYGRWVMGSAVVYWLTGAVYTPLVGSSAGLEQAGAYQAMQNLLGPLQQSLTALNNLFLPAVSRRWARQGGKGLGKTFAGIAGAGAALSCGYLVFLLLTGRWVVAFLYNRPYYDGFVALLPLLWLPSLIGTAASGPVMGLKAMRRTDLLFWSHAAGAAFTLIAGIAMVRALGIRGAALAAVLTATVICAACYLLFVSRLRKTR